MSEKAGSITLNELVYHILYKASSEQRIRVPAKFLKHVGTSRAARSFADKGKIGEKLELLSHLGIAWALVFFDKKKNSYQTIGQLINSIPEGNRTSVLKDVIARNFYVLSDRQYIYELNLLADTIGGKEFSPNLFLSKAGYHVRKWDKQIGSGQTQLSKEQIESSKYIVESMLNTAINIENTKSLINISSVDFEVLSFLYLNHTEYVPVATILDRLHGARTKAKVSGSLRRLVEGDMIHKSPVSDGVKYQISVLGISAISKFWQHILKANEI